MEGVILVRSIQCKSLAKYSLFYAYIVSLLAKSLSFLVAYMATPTLFLRLYWPLASISSVLGCGVILEIIRHMFVGQVSLGRLARRGAAIVFGMIFLEVSILAILLRWNPALYQAHLETDLSLAQAVGLMSIIALTGHYSIEVGKNIKGVIVGFGVYLGASLISMPLRVFFGGQFSPAWRVIQISAYLTALVIWAVSL